MKLRALVFENFRRYQQKTVIPIDDLTAFIGRNDVGKSTILEALDIFFGGGTKIDFDDATKNSGSHDVRIGLVFDEFPEVLDLDRGAQTTLWQEHLLNPDGHLEIHKTYNVAAARITPKVIAVANHPTNRDVEKLLLLKLADLKAHIKERGLESECDQTKNPSMRHALYRAAGDLGLAVQEVSLGDGEGKNIWTALSRFMPEFALFKADRVNTDQDAEAQNPMKTAIAQALAKLGPQLEDITNQVRDLVIATAERTLDTMKESYPDVPLASVLEPRFEEPSWHRVFKIELEAGDGVPLAKRGSGVRRLILMSFFQAEAERLKKEREDTAGFRVPVIYAIEEPETSQHPDNQKRIMDAFKTISESGDQVLITTHTPGLGSMLPIESLRYLDDDPNTQLVRIRQGSNEVFDEVANALGVYAEPVTQTGIRVVFATEGKTDIDAILSFYRVLNDAEEFPDIDFDRVFLAIGGSGGTLKDWVTRRYFEKLDVPMVFLVDSDRDGEGLPVSRTSLDISKECDANPDATCFITRKRTIENYAHPDAIERVSNGTVVIDPTVNIDFGKMYIYLGDSIRNAVGAGQIDFSPIDHNGQNLGVSAQEVNCKKIITSYVMLNMTAEEIGERSRYIDPESGTEKNEIVQWLTAIRENSIQ